jgi:uncharacterized RDD family membrane protein YckC
MNKKPSTKATDPQYAGFAKRLKAFGFDYLLIVGYIILLAGATLTVIKISGYLGFSLDWPENPVLADLLAFVTLVLPVILYFTLQESSPQKATWGKSKAGICVVNADGGMLTRKQAFVRSLVKMVPWQIGHTCLFQVLAVTPVPPAVTVGYVLLYILVGIYVATALISKKHRTPYDLIAGSYVIVKKQNQSERNNK